MGPPVINFDDPLLSDQQRRALVGMASGLVRQVEEDKAREEERRRREALWDIHIPFVDTSVAKLIFDTMERCTLFGQNGLIIGAAGVGKTRALQEALRRSNDLEGPSIGLVTITGVIGQSTMAVFEEICPHLGVRPATSIAETQRRLMKHACFHPVMVFDEAQNLTLKSVREILFISEQSRVQMLFCGNSEVLRLVNSAQAAIQQIARRLPVREEIPCILESDADLVASHLGVEGMDAYALCRAIGGTFHIDGVVKVLMMARRRAGEGKTIRLDHIRAALDLFPQFKVALAPKSAPVTARVRRVRPLKP